MMLSRSNFSTDAEWLEYEKEEKRKQELRRLIEDVKTKWYGFAIGTHSGIDAVTASAALYAALGIPINAEEEK